MALDALSIIAAGYGAYFAKSWISEKYGIMWSMDKEVFVASVMFVMVLNNYIMAQLHLYSDKKPKSYLSLLLSILKAILIDFF